jgi:sarcosine oxidase subunit alpha
MRDADPSKTFVCFCHDVTLKDLDSALSEGFDNPESAKRYTTATMGPCQGGMCQSNFARVLAEKLPQTQGQQNLTTPRAPATPIALGAMAAEHHAHAKITPLHQVQIDGGGRPFRTGPWLRIEHFGDPEAEALAVHQSAGLVDVSTLGKIRVFGPDAAKLLNRVYLRAVEGLAPGRILYNAMCNEEGVVIDDGAIMKKAENDYLLTTSTARAAAAGSWFGRWCRVENWSVWLANLTDAYAGMNLAGPQARKILQKLTPADLSDQTLPHLHWAEMEIAGVQALVMRMGFLGELSFEMHVPSSCGAYLWSQLLKVGAEFGIRPGGLETQFICRLEKGHALPGLDIDGNTTLFEAHLGWLWDHRQEDVVGGPMLGLIKEQPFRQTVVGFCLQGRTGIKDGFLVLEGPGGKERLGHVTSCRYSRLLDQTVGLALVAARPQFKPGNQMTLAGEDQEFSAPIVKPPFYDPTGERMRI